MNKSLHALFVALLLPAVAFAQHWRVEISGGGTVLTALNSVKALNIPATNPDRLMQLPDGQAGTLMPIGSLRLMRRDSAWEYGLCASVLNLSFKDKAIDGSMPDTFFIHRCNIARPAIPLRAFFNYTHQLRKTYGYIGLNAGAVFAFGREGADLAGLHYHEDLNIDFNSSVGYTIGSQLGIRHIVGRFDLGLELAANYIHLDVTQGPKRRGFRYDLFYLPLQLCAGYSF